jgi:oligopeptide/dipeptide ABC transporter ATP-binding protein
VIGIFTIKVVRWLEDLLKIENLKTIFNTVKGKVTAVDEVSFSLGKEETLAVVGESGSGKSVTALSLMRLIDAPGEVIGGRVEFDGIDLLSLKETEMQKRRGNDISMIFQEPMTSLNPVFTVGNQIIEGIRKHQRISKSEAAEKAVGLLKLVGIPLPERRLHEYPHQLSGGMRQRVMIAMALSSNPKLLIADEPTTALDVTIQAQILELIKKIKEELGMSILIITHDLGVVAEMADRVVVMYAGKVVEEADVVSIFDNPQHPYTKGLLNSNLSVDVKIDRLSVIKGNVPHPSQLPQGCRFHPRCSAATDICKQKEPQMEEIYPGRKVSCWLAGGDIVEQRHSS